MSFVNDCYLNESNITRYVVSQEGFILNENFLPRVPMIDWLMVGIHTDAKTSFTDSH